MEANSRPSALSSSIPIAFDRFRGRHGRVSSPDGGQEPLAIPIISAHGAPVRRLFVAAARKNNECPEKGDSHGFAPANPSFQFAHDKSNPRVF
jgi:hypothetical protein